MKISRASEGTATWTFDEALPDGVTPAARVCGQWHDLSPATDPLKWFLLIHGPTAPTPPGGSVMVTTGGGTKIRVSDVEATTGPIYLTP